MWTTSLDHCENCCTIAAVVTTCLQLVQSEQLSYKRWLFKKPSGEDTKLGERIIDLITDKEDDQSGCVPSTSATRLYGCTVGAYNNLIALLHSYLEVELELYNTSPKESWLTHWTGRVWMFLNRSSLISMPWLT